MGRSGFNEINTLELLFEEISIQTRKSSEEIPKECVVLQRTLILKRSNRI